MLVIYVPSDTPAGEHAPEWVGYAFVVFFILMLIGLVVALESGKVK